MDHDREVDDIAKERRGFDMRMVKEKGPPVRLSGMKALLASLALLITCHAAKPMVSFTYSEAKGIGQEKNVCRRDPSDVIKVGDTHYIWYSRLEHGVALYPHGYSATVWYATSTDDGHTWEEKGESVGLSEEGFDSHGVFTPNIVVHGGKYYLAYTGVAKGLKNTG